MDGLSNPLDQTVPRKIRPFEIPFLRLNSRSFLHALLVFTGYYFGSKIGFALTFSPYAVSTLWPPNSILLAALLISPIRNWWFLILAAFPAHLAVQIQSDVPLAMLLCWFISNSLEALIGAGLYRYVQKHQVQFNSVHDVTQFLICVAFMAPFLSSFVDAGFVILNDFSTEGYWHVWRMRFCSNVLAAFTLVPVILAWSRIDLASFRKLKLTKILEIILLTAGLLVVTIVVFNGSKAGTGASAALLYAPLPFLLWSATRFGFKGLSASILTVAFFAIWGAVHSHGPFSSADPVQNAFSIQVFLLVFSIPLTYLTAVLHERKEAQEIAVQNEERLSLALTAAQMCTWDWDLETNQVSTSDEAYRIFGTKPDNHNLDFCFQIMHPDDRTVVSNTLKEAIEDRSSYEIEFRIVQPNGNVQWMRARGEVLSDNTGRAVSVHGVIMDITKRKEAEIKEREQRRELYLLSRVAVLGEFTGALAHELNQPLAAIMSNTQAAQLFLSKGAQEEVREALNDIIEQDNRAFDVIGRLRELLRKGEVERSPINLNEILEKVLTITNSELISRKISVFTQLSSDLPQVEGDVVQLEQVLMNLILNAAEAMSAPEIANRKLVVASSAPNGEFVEISIEDCGKGISSEDLERIFKPFYTTKENGLGLGLSISRSIATAHGGKLWVTKNQEAGATFHLTLPSM